MNLATSFTQGKTQSLPPNRRGGQSPNEGEDPLSKKRFIDSGFLQLPKLGSHPLNPPHCILHRTYLWDPSAHIATRVPDEAFRRKGIVCAEDLYLAHDALINSTALFGFQAGHDPGTSP